MSHRSSSPGRRRRARQAALALASFPVAATLAGAVATPASADVTVGGGGDDRISSGRGKDRLIGGSGDDHLVGGHGQDLPTGRRGFDRCDGETQVNCEPSKRPGAASWTTRTPLGCLTSAATDSTCGPPPQRR